MGSSVLTGPVRQTGPTICPCSSVLAFPRLRFALVSCVFLGGDGKGLGGAAAGPVAACAAGVIGSPAWLLGQHIDDFTTGENLLDRADHVPRLEGLAIILANVRVCGDSCFGAEMAGELAVLAVLDYDDSLGFG